jgi:hypothetical protein
MIYGPPIPSEHTSSLCVCVWGGLMGLMIDLITESLANVTYSLLSLLIKIYIQQVTGKRFLPHCLLMKPAVPSNETSLKSSSRVFREMGSTWFTF